MSSKTYVKRFRAGFTAVTVEPINGAVMEHPFDSARGGGYGRKTRTRFPALKARSIGRGLRRAGYQEASRG